MAEKEVKKLKLQIGGDEYIFAGDSSGAGETWGKANKAQQLLLVV